MSFARQLRHELGEELRLVSKLVFHLLELLPASVAWQNRGVIVLDQGTKLLDADKNLDNKLRNFGLFTAQHRLVENLVKEFIVNTDQIFKYLNGW